MRKWMTPKLEKVFRLEALYAPLVSVKFSPMWAHAILMNSPAKSRPQLLMNGVPRWSHALP